ncbi:hypothetical protein [Nonomuraea sp. LPB2021202275-12-8]|uniref:hypothetical protein n=1 Tax=Nonomuraea sp. LPB2021202275-12-8 TaxID=3120159 RepID=UPI00300D4E71
MINVYSSTPRPPPVMVWTPSHTFAFLAEAAAPLWVPETRPSGLTWGFGISALAGMIASMAL